MKWQSPMASPLSSDTSKRRLDGPLCAQEEEDEDEGGGKSPYVAPASVFDSPRHLLHGVLHQNGFGHLLRVNGREGGSTALSGAGSTSCTGRLHITCCTACCTWVAQGLGHLPCIRRRKGELKRFSDLITSLDLLLQMGAA